MFFAIRLQINPDKFFNWILNFQQYFGPKNDLNAPSPFKVEGHLKIICAKLKFYLHYNF